MIKLLTSSKFGIIRHYGGVAKKSIVDWLNIFQGVWQCQTYGFIVGLVPSSANQICKVISVGLVPPNAIITIKVERKYDK